MQGFFNEFALDFETAAGERLPVIANAAERRDADGTAPVHALVVIKATDRRRYERELVEFEIASCSKGLATSSARRPNCGSSSLPFSVMTCAIRSRRSARGARILQRSGALQDDKELRVLDMMQHDRDPHVGPDRQRSRFRTRPAGRRHHPEPRRQPAAASRCWSRWSTNFAQHHPIAASRAASPSTEPVNCDRSRVGQLASNLIGNALTHGAAYQPVRVGAKTEDGVFELWVANAGEPIPDDRNGKALRTVLPRRSPLQPTGPRAWPAHRLADRPGARRQDRRNIHTG